MRESINKSSVFTFIFILLLVKSGQAIATTLLLVSTEQEPYIGIHLLNKGYVHELVTEVFKRAGYKVDIQFYPLARAKYLAEKGAVDGLLPSYSEESLQNKFILSKPFPGDYIGLLKKKSSHYNDTFDAGTKLKEALFDLQEYKFGMVRGSPLFEQNKSLKKQLVITDLQNIDKLESDRINFAVIDKYTASNLMVNQRPHLIGKLAFVPSLIVSRSFHVAFPKKSENHMQRRKDFNLALLAITQDGTLDKLLIKHGLFLPKAENNEKVKLTIGTVNNAEMIVMRDLSQEFEKTHPNIELEWRIFNENILRQRLLSDFAISDGQFDVMTIGSYEAPIWAKKGWLTALNDLPQSYDLKDIIESVRQALSHDKKLYALPFYAESSMTFYRKDLFKKAGIKISSQPTYDDIKKYAAAIHDPDKKIYGICLRGKAGWGENIALIDTMVNVFGGRWFDLNWDVKIDSVEWKEAISTYKDLLVNYGPPNPTGNGFNENRQLFSNGHCGIWIDATVAAGMLFNNKQSKIYDQIGFAPAPIAVTSKGANWLWTWAFAVPKSSKNKKEATQFILWATSKGYIKQVAQQKGWAAVPPGTRISTYENKHYRTAAPFSDFVLSAIEKADLIDSTLKAKPYRGIQFVGIPEFPAIGRLVGIHIAEVIKGEESVENALRNAQKSVQELMDKSGY